MALTPVTPPTYPNVPRSPGVPPVMRQAGAIENTVVAVASDAINVVKQFLGLGPTWGIFSPKTGQPVFVSDSVIAVDYRQEWNVARYPIELGGFVDYNKVKEPFDIRVTFAFSGNQGLLGSLIPGGALLSLIPGFSGADSRRTMLQMLDAAIATTDLVSVVTPEAQYPMVNIVHYDYRREARNGAALIKVDVWCQEIRPSAKPAFSKSGQLTGTDPIAGPGTGGGTGPSATQGTGGTGSGGTGGGDGGNGGANAPSQPSGASPADGGTVQPQQVTGPNGATAATSGAPGTQSGQYGSGATIPVSTTPGASSPFSAAPPGTVPLYDQDGAFTGSFVKPGSPVPPGYFAPPHGAR